MTPADELMALAGKATPGEWRQEHRRTATGGYSTEVFDEAGKPIATLAWHALPTRYEGEVGITSTDRQANAAFIAAACNFVRSDAFRAMVRDAWLPIESAPRNDTVIVVMEATERNKAFANWRDSVPVYIDEHGVIFDVGTSTPEVGIASGNWRATHWRPLPAPPQAIDAAASGAGGS